jgi:hypothetical protein
MGVVRVVVRVVRVVVVVVVVCHNGGAGVVGTTDFQQPTRGV